MEKKFDLENFVKQNHEFFNTEEPKEGHFDRFKAKLEPVSVKKNSFLYRSMRYAAVIVLLVTSVLIYTQTDLFKSSNDSFAENNSNEITEDFNEISSYYTSQIDQKLIEINNIECKQGVDQKEIVNNDLKDLNASYSELQNEYNNDPQNSMIKNALINNYQLRINILDLVMNKLKNYC